MNNMKDYSPTHDRYKAHVESSLEKYCSLFSLPLIYLKHYLYWDSSKAI